MKQDNLFDELLDDEGTEKVAFDESQNDNDPLDDEFSSSDDEKDDDQDLEQKEQEKQESKEESTTYKFEESESINRILESKGINPHEILYEDENGDEVSVDFYELDPEEQLNLLQYNPNQYDLEENEIEVINFLRESETTLEDYIDYVRKTAIEEYLNSSASYDIDAYSDEEVYASLLKDQFPNLTDEEIELEIEKEKTNQSLFEKKVSQVREYYKAQAEEIKQKEEEAKAAELERTQTESKKKLANAAIATEELMGFEIDDKDRSETFDFIFNQDATGKSKFFKLLENPEKLFKVALFALKEEEINKTLEQEFKKAYNNTKPPIIKSPISTQKAKVSIKGSSPTKSQSSTSSKSSIDDLYNDLLK